jgi:hypothetical protein
MATPIDVRLIANLAPPDWWTIGLTAAATILGAVIGAIIAYVVARQTATENREALRAMRRDSEEAATLRAEIKLMELMNAVAGYYIQTEKCIEMARTAIGGEVELWRAMRSFAGKPKEIIIDADDLTAFARAREFTYLTKLLFLVSRYNCMIYGVEAYGKRRDELMAMITPTEMNGLVGSITMNDMEMRRLAPYIATVHNLALQARSDIKDVYDSALAILDDFGPIVRKYFDDPKFPIPGRTNRESAETH